MTATQPPPPANLIKQFTTFIHTGAGLEKTLRLIQAVSLTVAAVSINSLTATRWSTAKSNLALSRRYFRFFNFIDCFGSAYGILGTDKGGIMLSLIDISRWTCLGLYILLEDATLLDAMNVWPTPWSKPVLINANKYWFYALCLSITGALWELLFTSAVKSTQPQNQDEKKEKEDEKSSAPATATATAKQVSSTAPLIKRIVIDGCDLLIPASFLGWIHVGDAVVGSAMVVSTLVAARDIWVNTQRG